MRVTSGLWGGIACAAIAPSVSAQLWTTGLWDGIDGRPSDRATPAVRPQTRAADDFTLPAGNGQPYTITGLSGRALAVHYSGAFAEIYADSGGHPAATPSFTLSSSSLTVLQTSVFGRYDLVNVSLDTTGLSLTPGTWWVSIVCDVSGDAPPNDGYGFFCTAGNMVVQGSQGYYRTDTNPWLPSSEALGFPSDFSFTVLGAQNTLCYPNCDNSTNTPILNINDFLCFLNRFAAGDSYANCDHSTTPPVLNINDFLCFLNSFASGCG
jgi:hypothetical protein